MLSSERHYARAAARTIMLSPAVTLQDAAVKLRRLSVYLEDREPVRLLEGALEAVRAGGEE